VINSAGIIFLAPEDKALFLKRSSSAPDYPRFWDFPGGAAEDDEMTLETALREAKEEVGRLPKGDRVLLTRSITNVSGGVATPQPLAPAASPAQSSPAGAGTSAVAAASALPAAGAAPPSFPVPAAGDQVDYSTFLQRVDREFEPQLSLEHEGYAWAPVSSPPEPLHPGCRIALDRLSMDELDVARAVVAGLLTSPQRYENVWLFDIRITGTDTAYRNKLDEYCYRPPEVYYNEEFLARCNGLTVVWKHPKKETLDGKEFEDRAIGSIFVPYLSDGVRHPPNEVWGVAKVYDEDAADWMQKHQMSTSPAVVFRPILESQDTNKKIDLENGSTLLIEGKPSLLDHVAVCEAGVWDKMEKPSGVVATRSDSVATLVALPPDKLRRLDREITLLSIRMSNRAAARRGAGLTGEHRWHR
jgi:8-oxo-dGTP pyrophosphatase MutT (NUDIX family)